VVVVNIDGLPAVLPTKLYVTQSDITIRDLEDVVIVCRLAKANAVRDVVPQCIGLDAGAVPEALPGAGCQGDRVGGIGRVTRESQQDARAGEFAVVIASAHIAVAVGDEIRRQRRAPRRQGRKVATASRSDGVRDGSHLRGLAIPGSPAFPA